MESKSPKNQLGQLKLMQPLDLLMYSMGKFLWDTKMGL